MHFRIVMNVLLKDAVCVEPDSLMDGKVPSQNIVYINKSFISINS